MHLKQDESVAKIKSEASKLRRLGAIEKQLGIEYTPSDFWKQGEYLDILTVIEDED